VIAVAASKKLSKRSGDLLALFSNSLPLEQSVAVSC
jgi:hypothetical protein